ncbi:MAG: hypothetical protein EAZ43_11735 [Betaproteobacteria bacterium]|nr:MAG: hypothetical protein EAZ43_11735 [Betaproteobacteria bacterium]
MLFLILIAIKNPDAVAKLLGVVIAFMSKTMERIINNTLFESKPANFIRMKAVETVTGHIEFSAYRPTVWHEVCELQGVIEPQTMTDDRAAELAAERAAQSIEDAARRAKRNVRQSCKSINADTLLTLTYRENQTSLETTKKHLKEFTRRLYRLWPEFVGVAGFERQKRGAWHVHIATVNIPDSLSRNGIRLRSYHVLRSVWRGVVGNDNGNIDVSRRKRNAQRSPARIASYLSKYITKAFEEGEKHSNRWTKFGAIPKPRRIDLGNWSNMAAALQAAYDLISQTQSVVTTFFSAVSGAFYMAVEPHYQRRLM